MSFRFSLSTKANLANFVFISLLALAGVITYVLGSHQVARVIESRAAASLAADTAPKLIRLIKNMQIDVIQVQQWFTDISATRGLDGLNDGFDEAEAAANGFEEKSKQAIELAQEVGLTEMAEAVVAVRERFPAYYDAGRQMAEAYVAEGPSGGNRMMGDFDAIAEELGSQLDYLAMLTNSVAETAATTMSEHLDATAENAERLVWILGVLPAISIGIGLLVAIAVRLIIAKPIAQLTGVMRDLSGGSFDVEIIGADRTDEIGDMARAVHVFKDNALEKVRLEAEQDEAERRAAEEKHQAMMEMANNLEDSVSGIIRVVSSAANKMQTAAQTMSTTSEETSVQATTVVTASEQASNNVNTVASATEELSSSVSEISSQVARSSEITHRAVEETNATTGTVRGMSEAAQRIGDVVNLINDIADQTNLLALNATIEAARAGDAGKGFAVVASEVKNLATQTAKATEDIAGQIVGIQSVTDDSVKAIESISNTIEEVNHVADSIAAAVEEQAAATQEIARNVQEAAVGTQEVSTNISIVTQAADETGLAANQVLDAANDLASQTETLRQEVDKFLVSIRAA